MENLCDAYPAVMPFIPTTALMSKLIHKATLIKSNEDIQLQINPKERKRVNNETDVDEPIY
jgi:hypothetical protein